MSIADWHKAEGPRETSRNFKFGVGGMVIWLKG